jgi:hypothetical protein
LAGLYLIVGMDDVTDTRHISRLEIVDTGRRRRWSAAEKLRIVEESFSGPRLASATARRHGISNQLLSDKVAEALTGLEKTIAAASRLEFVDTEVFLDGLICGRAFYDTRLDWEENDLGDCRTKAVDPFTVYPDPDADTYDLNESAAFMQTSKFVSLDEIEAALGRDVADLIRPFTLGQTPLAPISSLVVNDEITPRRFFGEREDLLTDWWDNFYSLMGDFVDRHRKTIRIIETQYKMRELRNVIIDLETGDKKVLPQDWAREKIEKALLYCEMVQNPCVVQRRMVERIHWTTMAGDLILYDAPSPYDAYTQTPYFPYFRRGMTRGMVEDLVDPQKEKNKRRSAEVEIISKTANGGWMFHETTDPLPNCAAGEFLRGLARVQGRYDDLNLAQTIYAGPAGVLIFRCPS